MSRNLLVLLFMAESLWTFNHVSLKIMYLNVVILFLSIISLLYMYVGTVLVKLCKRFSRERTRQLWSNKLFWVFVIVYKKQSVFKNKASIRNLQVNIILVGSLIMLCRLKDLNSTVTSSDGRELTKKSMLRSPQRIISLLLHSVVDVALCMYIIFAVIETDPGGSLKTNIFIY